MLNPNIWSVPIFVVTITTYTFYNAIWLLLESAWSVFYPHSVYVDGEVFQWIRSLYKLPRRVLRDLLISGRALSNNAFLVRLKSFVAAFLVRIVVHIFLVALLLEPLRKRKGSPIV